MQYWIYEVIKIQQEIKQIFKAFYVLIETLHDNNLITLDQRIKLIWWLYHPEKEVQEAFRKHQEKLQKKLLEINL